MVNDLSYDMDTLELYADLVEVITKYGFSPFASPSPEKYYQYYLLTAERDYWIHFPKEPPGIKKLERLPLTITEHYKPAKQEQEVYSGSVDPEKPGFLLELIKSVIE